MQRYNMHLELEIRDVSKAQLVHWKLVHQQLPTSILEKLLQRFNPQAQQEYKLSPYIPRAAFARATGLTVHAVRHYTREGLFPILRFAKKHLYPYTALETAWEISTMRELGLSISEMKIRLSQVLDEKKNARNALAKKLGLTEIDINDPKQRQLLRRTYAQAENINLEDIAQTAKQARENFKATVRTRLEQQKALIEAKLEKLDNWK